MSEPPKKIDRTVDQYLANFRSAMMALVPAYEYIGMAWQDPHAYDEWENVTRELYKHIVAAELIDVDVQDKYYPMIGYDLLGWNYNELSYIHVKDEPRLVFVGFITESRPFETCRFTRIGRDGARRFQETREFAETSFASLLRPKG